MPPKRRKAAEVQTTYCDVELSQQLSHEAAAAIAQDVCKHIMFMRNQIPMLYKELRDKAEVFHTHLLHPFTLDWHFLQIRTCMRAQMSDCNTCVQEASAAATTGNRLGKHRKADKVHGCPLP